MNLLTISFNWSKYFAKSNHVISIIAKYQIKFVLHLNKRSEYIIWMNIKNREKLTDMQNIHFDKITKNNNIIVVKWINSLCERSGNIIKFGKFLKQRTKTKNLLEN